MKARGQIVFVTFFYQQTVCGISPWAQKRDLTFTVLKHAIL